jgi:N-acetylneuraminic acid mutarotase
MAALCSLVSGISSADDGQLVWDTLPSLPDARGVAGPFAGVSGGALIVAGGANFPEGAPWEGGKKVWHEAIYVLPDPAGAWKTVSRLPRPLAYGVSLTTARGIVCAGGSDAERNMADVFLLTWDGRDIQFKSLAALPLPCANACGAVLGETLYVAGGEEKPGATAALKTFWSLDMADAKAQWKELPAWPGSARTLAAGGAQADAFYLMGGVSLAAGADGKPVRTYLKDCYRFDPKKGTWERIADLPKAVAAAPSPAPAAGQSHLLLLGGDDGSKVGFQPVAQHPGFSRQIWAYHTITDTWRVMGEVPAAQVTVPAVLWQGRFVVPSGEIRPGVRSPSVQGGRLIGEKAASGSTP